MKSNGTKSCAKISTYWFVLLFLFFLGLFLTWQGYLIDGHHRYEICSRENLSFKMDEMEFEDEDAVKVWMIDNQFGRRNITDAAKIRLALKKEAILSKDAEKLAVFKKFLRRWKYFHHHKTQVKSETS